MPQHMEAEERALLEWYSYLLRVFAGIGMVAGIAFTTSGEPRAVWATIGVVLIVVHVLVFFYSRPLCVWLNRQNNHGRP